MSAPARVAVVFGGPSPEHDVSILTGLLACHELQKQGGRELHGIYWTKNGAFVEVDPSLEAAAFLDGPPQKSAPLELRLGPGGGFVPQRGRFGGSRDPLAIDAALVCCHGGPGEDGALQGALDLAGVPYSGPSALGAAIGMDKLASGAILESAGIPVLVRRELVPTTEDAGGPGPYLVKPRFGGSSIGIDVVADLATARARLGANVHLRRGAVIEPYRPDLFDLQLAVRTYPAIELSAIERPLRQNAAAEILDYRDKYVGGEGMHAAPRELPAVLDAKLADALREAARAAASLLLVRGVCRVDFLSDGRTFYLNEVNTVPGSLSRHLFIEPARSFAELLDGLLAEAVERPAAQFSAAGADGTVLRSAGSIAGKLG